MFADFFGRNADHPVARALEVECRSAERHDPRCRFLIGSAEVMGQVYEEMGRGAAYPAAVAEVGG